MIISKARQPLASDYIELWVALRNYLRADRGNALEQNLV